MVDPEAYRAESREGWERVAEGWVASRERFLRDTAPVSAWLLDAGDGDEHVTLPATHDLAAPAIVVFTSGTGGASKPIELTYGNWLWSALGSAVALGCPPGERWLCALPLTHVGGLSILLRSVIAATTAIVHERFETERVLDALMAPGGPTIVCGRNALRTSGRAIVIFAMPSPLSS